MISNVSTNTSTDISQELDEEHKFLESLTTLMHALVKIVEDLQYYQDQTSMKRYVLGSWLETNAAKWIESLEAQYQTLNKLGANMNSLVTKQQGGEELNRDETKWRKVWLKSLKMNIDDAEALSKDLFDVKVSSKLLPSHSTRVQSTHTRAYLCYATSPQYEKLTEACYIS